MAFLCLVLLEPPDCMQRSSGKVVRAKKNENISLTAFKENVKTSHEKTSARK